MRKKGLLFSLMSLLCVATTAGCGGSGEDSTKFNVAIQSSDDEYGSVAGGGNYKSGETVNLKVYPNIGCDDDAPTLDFYVAGSEEGSVPESITSLQYDSEGKYYQYTLKVSDSTIGKYVANFTCKTNDPNGENAVKAKYIVNFHLVKEDGSVQENILDSKEVLSGEKISETKYLDSIEGKLQWYTGYDSSSKEFSGVFDFSKAINDNVTLYAKIIDSSPIDVVRASIDTFKYDSSRIQITYGEEVASIVDGPLVKRGTDDFNTKANIKVADANGTKFIIKDNTYHVYSQSYYKAFKLENSGFSTAKAIPEAYKFIDIIDFKVDEGTYVVEKSGTINDFEISDGSLVTCGIYSVVSKGEGNAVMNLYIHNGNLYKIEKADGTIISIKYPTNLAGTNIPSDKVKNMYSINLFSNDSGLNALLTERNADFGQVLKITPSLDVDLETLLSSEENSVLYDELRRYEFEFYTYVNKTCTNVKFTNSSTISKNMNLCVKVNMIDEQTPVLFDYVQSAIDDLSIGGYEITTSISAFGGEQTLDKTYMVGTKEDLLSSDNKPESMASVTWNTLQALKNLGNNYYRFSYDSVNREYSFYTDKFETYPYLKVTLTEDLKLSKIIFFDSPVNGGDGNTYTSTIEYNSDRYTLAALNDLWNGGYGFDVEGSERAKPLIVDKDKDLMWIIGMYKTIAESETATAADNKNYEDLNNLSILIKDIEDNNDSFVYDDETKEYTKSDGDVYKFTFDEEGRITKLLYTPLEENTIVYEIYYN